MSRRRYGLPVLLRLVSRVLPGKLIKVREVMAEEAPEAAESLVIYCPKCGNRTIAKLSFSGGDTLDYEGVCEG